MTKMFDLKTVRAVLNSRTAAPFPPDYFLRRILVPEVTILLLAEDMHLSPDDPKVKITLEASRAFGNAVHSKEVDGVEGSTLVQQIKLASPQDQKFHSQIPAWTVPYIESVFDPPAYGNCGYFAIAAAVGDFSDSSYLNVRKKLLAELSAHTEDHEKLISSAHSQPSMRTRRNQTIAVEVVQDLLVRLDHHDTQCSHAYWLRMPYMGYIIASAYNRVTVLLGPSESECVTFFPYRTPPNKELPIVLGFMNNNHFVTLRPQNRLPLPRVFGRDRTPAIFESTAIPSWVEEFRDHLASWTDLQKSPQS